MKDAKYHLFLRNWMNNIAQETHLDQAIAKGFITEEDKVEIMNTPRN